MSSNREPQSASVHYVQRWIARLWLGHGLFLVVGALAVSLLLGTGGAGSVSVAGVQVAAPAPIAAAPGSHEADDAWASLAPELDASWERDWSRTIAATEGIPAALARLCPGSGQAVRGICRT